MADSFEVELRRLVRKLEATAELSDGARAASRRLLDLLVESEARARGLPTTSLTISGELLPMALSAVAHDASVAGVDLECMNDAVVAARRALSAS